MGPKDHPFPPSCQAFAVDPSVFLEAELDIRHAGCNACGTNGEGPLSMIETRRGGCVPFAEEGICLSYAGLSSCC